MLKKDLILKSPISKILCINDIQKNNFGCVLSRAGIGKTNFLVQIAITQLLSDKKVFHICLNDRTQRINLRYNEGFKNLIDSVGYIDPKKAKKLWDEIKINKIPISYNKNTFDTIKIKNYLQSFQEADLALPSIMIVDGLDFSEEKIKNTLEQFKDVQKDFPIGIWFSIQTHRDEKLNKKGFPIQLETHKENFNKAFFLFPIADKIESRLLINKENTGKSHTLNPVIMGIRS